MKINERIKALKKQRADILAKSEELSNKAANETRLFTEDEQRSFDGFLTEVRAIDKNIEGLLEQERLLASSIDPAPLPGDAPRATPGVEVKAFKTFPGQSFTRLVQATIISKGNMGTAADYAMRWKDQTPEVETVLRAIARSGQHPSEVLRAAVAAGNTTDSTWAGPLVYAQNMASEFIELLKNATIVGKLNLRPVPFNIRIPRQTGAAAVGWVGEGMSKPVTKPSFDSVTIPWAKMAAIVVITDELARFSNPAAEMLVRDDLITSIAQYRDQQFIDPAVAASAALRPGSITNGVTPHASTGATVAAIDADVGFLLKQMAAANMDMTGLVWIMTPSARITLQMLRTTQDYVAYPEVQNMMFKGYPIVESNSVPTAGTTTLTTELVLVQPSEIFHAEDAAIDIATSNEASLQMDSAPATPATPLVSMFQQNMTAIKAEQYQYWLRRRLAAVQYISGFVV